jgi:hypothetical protein
MGNSALQLNREQQELLQWCDDEVVLVSALRHMDYVAALMGFGHNQQCERLLQLNQLESVGRLAKKVDQLSNSWYLHRNLQL